MIYRERQHWSVADAEAAVGRDDPLELADMAVDVALDPPGRIWAENLMVRLSLHPSNHVRGNAIVGLGYLAMIYRYLNRSRVQPIIEAALADPDDFVRDQADAAADDIEWFLGWVLRGREQNRQRAVCPS